MMLPKTQKYLELKNSWVLDTAVIQAFPNVL